MKKPIINFTEVSKYAETILGGKIHAKRIESIANGALGIIEAADLSIHGIGHGLAAAKGLVDKHAIKQVDRYLSNYGINIWEFFWQWIPYQLGTRSDAFLAFDWTEYASDDQATVTLYLISSHGRATPLLWMSVVKSTMAGQRNGYEDELLIFLQLVLKKTSTAVAITILADRGFGDQKLYALLAKLDFNYIIRFRQGILVESAEGESKAAQDWLLANGKARLLRGAKVTTKRYEVGAVVCVHAKGMKDPWCLVTNYNNVSAAMIVQLYGLRFTIEESFRDIKDNRYGMGLKSTHIGTPARRDRLLIIAAIATVLLTLLGAAGESLGMDRMLKANTSKKRSHSLFRQGCLYYNKLPNMKPDLRKALEDKFAQLIKESAAANLIFGLI